MPKKTDATNYNLATLQPDELNALKDTVKEFLKRKANIEHEIETLKEDLKALLEEYKEKLDMKVLQAAMKVVKIEQGVPHKDTYDMFMEVLKDDVVNDHYD